MSLIHPKPRFGYDEDADMVYDYVAGRDVPISDHYESTDGTAWNLTLLVKLTLSGQQIMAARVASKVKAAPPAPKVEPKAPALTIVPPPVKPAEGPATTKPKDEPVTAPPAPDAPPKPTDVHAGSGLPQNDDGKDVEGERL